MKHVFALMDNSYVEFLFFPRKLHFRIMHLSAALKCQAMNLLLKYENYGKKKKSLLAYFPLSSQSFAFVSGQLYSMQVRPLMNLVFQHNELDLWVSNGKKKKRGRVVFLFLSAVSSLVWICCRQIQREYRTSFIPYPLWIRADHKVCRIPFDAWLVIQISAVPCEFRHCIRDHDFTLVWFET